MNADDFTALLAGRLAAIVPAGFHVEAGTYVRANLGAYGETDADDLARVAAQALDELQDYVSEATHDPWPGTTAQPRPHVRIRDSMLHLGYGDPDTPILACAPIPYPLKRIP